MSETTVNEVKEQVKGPWRLKVETIANKTAERAKVRIGEAEYKRGIADQKDFFKTIDSFNLESNLSEWLWEKMCRIPVCFWVCSSSSSNKYHPKTSRGYFGLLNHTKAVVLIASVLGKVEYFQFSPKEQQMLIAASVIHDSMKRGTGPKFDTTAKNHPQLASILVEATSPIKLPEETIKGISGLVKTHMGQWGSNKPGNIFQAVCHAADLVSSRKFVSIDTSEGID